MACANMARERDREFYIFYHINCKAIGFDLSCSINCGGAMAASSIEHLLCLSFDALRLKFVVLGFY